MQISQDTFNILFLTMIFMSMGGIIIIPIIWVLLTLLTPKSLLDTYFKEPHFNMLELAFMNRLPSSLFRTAIFGWVTLLPFLDKKRKIKDCYKVMPTWYLISLKVFILISMAAFLIIFSILIFISLLDDVVK